MQRHKFIFSEERKLKVLRHLTFWLAWWLYFFVCFTLVQQPVAGALKPSHVGLGHHLPLKILLIILMYAIACYAVIYRLLPQLINQNWLAAAVHFLLPCLFLLVASHYLYWNVFPWIDSFSGHFDENNQPTLFWPVISVGLLHFTKVAASATIIKYVKYWWIKERENQQVEKEKIQAELRLLKAQVHPEFLFKTLDNLYAHALRSSPETSWMLLKLSELLSYMLYECDQPEVHLDREIEMMKAYMKLEKLRQHNEPEIQVSVRGHMHNKMIAPFLLLPFIENSFKYCSQMTEQSWMNLDLSVEGDHFSMKLTNGIPADLDEALLQDTNELAIVRKRLSLLYSDHHELRVTTAQEMFIVFLEIRLVQHAVSEPDLQYA